MQADWPGRGGAQRLERGITMRIKVDFDVCVSTAACMQACPQVFEVRVDGFLYILDEEPGEALRAAVEEAMQSCPTGAISVEE
jgi:ferredoxin